MGISMSNDGVLIADWWLTIHESKSRGAARDLIITRCDHPKHRINGEFS